MNGDLKFFPWFFFLRRRAKTAGKKTNVKIWTVVVVRGRDEPISTEY